MHNREKRNAVLDGRISLQYYLEFKQDYDEGLYTDEQAREHWFEHYDGLKSDIENYLDNTIRAKIMDEM